MHYSISVSGCDRTVICRDSDSLLTGLLRSNSRAVPAGCRGGGCGICKVRITSGEYEAGPMARCHISAEDQQKNIVLACRVYARSDITLEVVGKLARRFNQAA